MSQDINANVELWNELVPITEKAVEYYDAEGFKSRKMSLHSLEIEELGDVSGKSLLHLGCHFGQDTLSWARLGARVTGVDFSEKAIDRARSLSRELEIEADFVLANIYDLSDVLEGQYDIVFMSYGVINGLPDLQRWAQVISHSLKPEGFFYIAEWHPLSLVFLSDSVEWNNANDPVDWRVYYSYFHAPEPRKVEQIGTYADRSAEVSSHYYHWTHSLSDIVNALISAGLRLEFLHEFPKTIWRQLPFLEEDNDGWWRPREGGDLIPLLFSLKAVKEG